MSNSETTRVISKVIDETGVTFAVKDQPKLRVSFANLSAAVRDRALAHGIVQRVIDAAALSRDGKSGKSATPVEKWTAMKEIVDHLMSGTDQWSLAREQESPFVSLLTQCLCEIYPERTEEQVREWVKKRSAAERKAMLASEKVKPIAERIEAEKLKHIDTQELLDDLELME